jgi:hypothetical protein
MSAPHVAGGGALYLSSLPSSAPSSVEASLRTSAQSTSKFSKNGATIFREFVGSF